MFLRTLFIIYRLLVYQNLKRKSITIMWNYRVTFDGVEYAVREVYYDNAGYPTSWTENAVTITGLTVSEIYDTLELMKLALDKPVLEINNAE